MIKKSKSQHTFIFEIVIRFKRLSSAWGTTSWKHKSGVRRHGVELLPVTSFCQRSHPLRVPQFLALSPVDEPEEERGRSLSLVSFKSSTQTPNESMISFYFLLSYGTVCRVSLNNPKFIRGPLWECISSIFLPYLQRRGRQDLWDIGKSN